MRAYPHYRDSGIEWLGEVPEHWEVSRQSWSRVVGASPHVGHGGTKEDETEASVPTVHGELYTQHQFIDVYHERIAFRARSSCDAWRRHAKPVEAGALLALASGDAPHRRH